MKKIMFVMPLMAISLLASCNNGGGQDPVVYHTIKFNGTNCYMIDEIGGQVIEKQFEAGQTASYHLVGSSEKFEIPKKEDVSITYTKTGEAFDGTYSYNPTDGSLSVKMTADVTVTASSEENDPTVTEEEFYMSFMFEDVTYLQIETTANMPGIQVGTQTELLSPDKNYSLKDYSEWHGSGAFYDEMYYCKLSATDYKFIKRVNPATPWEETSWLPLEEEEWMTPQKEGGRIFEGMLSAGLEQFSPSKYDPATKSYTLYGTDNVSFTFKFKNKKLVSLDQMNGVSVTNLTYNKTEIVLPIPTPTVEFN